jgi:simple sugar transport system ATP-binding protein
MEIYQLIINLADRGKGIIFAGSEQSEILQITDRVYVMYDGTIRREFVTAETGEDQLMFYSTGGTE